MISLQPTSNGVDKKKKKDKETKKSKKKEAASKPMHFTANNEPRALDLLGDLDPNIFNECKEKMRPVKKALKALDSANHGMTADEFAIHRKECILKIGKRIDDCLDEYRDPMKVKEWRSNLWYFVSKFTEDNASRLFKLYKRVKDNGSESPAKADKKEKSSHKSHDEKKKEKKSRELKHKTDRDIHEKYKYEHDDPYGESFSSKRRLEREDGEIDDGKDYKRMSAADSR